MRYGYPNVTVLHPRTPNGVQKYVCDTGNEFNLIASQTSFIERIEQAANIRDIWKQSVMDKLEGRPVA